MEQFIGSFMLWNSWAVTQQPYPWNETYGCLCNPRPHWLWICRSPWNSPLVSSISRWITHDVLAHESDIFVCRSWFSTVQVSLSKSSEKLILDCSGKHIAILLSSENLYSIFIHICFRDNLGGCLVASYHVRNARTGEKEECSCSENLQYWHLEYHPCSRSMLVIWYVAVSFFCGSIQWIFPGHDTPCFMALWCRIWSLLCNCILGMQPFGRVGNSVQSVFLARWWYLSYYYCGSRSVTRRRDRKSVV